MTSFLFKIIIFGLFIVIVILINLLKRTKKINKQITFLQNQNDYLQKRFSYLENYSIEQIQFLLNSSKELNSRLTPFEDFLLNYHKEQKKSHVAKEDISFSNMETPPSETYSEVVEDKFLGSTLNNEPFETSKPLEPFEPIAPLASLETEVPSNAPSLPCETTLPVHFETTENEIKEEIKKVD
jgi:hypothetical protein